MAATKAFNVVSFIGLMIVIGYHQVGFLVFELTKPRCLWHPETAIFLHAIAMMAWGGRGMIGVMSCRVGSPPRSWPGGAERSPLESSSPLPESAMPLRLMRVLLVLAVLHLSGCGGGGSSSDDSSSSSSPSSTVNAPSITAQPASVSVTEGTAATLSVVASGSGTLSYQWRKGGSAISGATSASHTIAAATASDAGEYDVVVANAGGSVTSAVATVSVSAVNGSPLIAVQPSALTATVGSSVSFSVSATGSGTLAYQWRKGGSAISGATAATYTIASVATGDAGSYDVVVSNSVGSVTSLAVALTVTTTTSGALATSATTAAQAFLATLSTTQQAQVQLAWSLDTARRWSNLPASMVSRNGLSWSSLSTAQRTAARALIATALSSTGDTLHQGLQAADDYLYASGAGSSYGSGNYYIALLGTPSTSGFWLLQLTGHHLTYNIAFNGSVKSATPVFLGVEPKGAFTLSGTSHDPMSAQRSAFSNLGTALTAYSGAKLSGTYSDLLFGANGSGNIDGSCPRAYSSVTSHGLLYGSLSSTDQALVQAAIRAYVATQATEYADDLLSSYLSSSALAQTYVAYAGAGDVATNGSYIRIEGPRLWIEFSVQRGVIFSSDIHYHTIWRDKTGDYGGKCVS
jgi:hypothetical protein